MATNEEILQLQAWMQEMEVEDQGDLDRNLISLSKKIYRRMRDLESQLNDQHPANNNGLGAAPPVDGPAWGVAQIMTPFDPENRMDDIDHWLARLDQLATVHECTEAEKILIMQMRLVGVAQLWFNCLEAYDHSWQEWRSLLQQEFHREYDFAECLDEMLARVKQPEESMLRYYHEKMLLCRRVGIEGQKAISCLIGGLPESLRIAARMFECERPEDFLSGFLVRVDVDVRSVEGAPTVSVSHL